MNKIYSARQNLKTPYLLFSPARISSSLKSFFSRKMPALMLGYLFLAGFSFQSLGQTIGVPNVSTTPVCAGSDVTITFSVTNGTGSSRRFKNGTVYQAYLSNSSGGSFVAVDNPFSIRASYGGNNATTPGLTQTITIPAGTASGTGYRISIGSTTPTYNGSTGANKSSIFTVNALPVLTSSLTPPAICSNSTFTYSPTSSTAGTTFNWTRATVAGISNGAGSGVGSPGETLINTTGTAVDVTYVYTLVANGCTNPTTYDVVVSVKPTPTLSSTLAPSAICNNTVFNYTPTSALTGTTFSWARAAVGSISNTAASGTDNPAETLINTGSITVGVTYVYTVTANGCANPTTYNVVVPVRPTPTLRSSLTPPAVCSNTVFDYTPTSLTLGTAFNWTRSFVAGISNAAGSGSGNPSETLINTTASAVDVTYVYTLSVNGCTNPSTYNVVVSVKPTSVLSSTLTPAAICNNTLFSYTATSATGGTSFSWSRAVVAGISNSAASGGTASINETLINTTADPVDVTYVYTLIANGCSNTQSVVVSVNPMPVLTSTLMPPAICSNTIFNYIPTSSTTGAAFNWTRAVVAGISNSAGSGSGDPGETLINTTSGALSVTYVYTVHINGCANAVTYNVVVSVNPSATLSSSLTPPAICNNTLFSYTATSAIAGTGFSWTRAVVAGISNSAGSGGTAFISETLINTTTNPVSVTYVYTLNAPNSCNSFYNVVVVVKPTPVLSSTQSTSICNNTLFSYSATSATTGTSFSWTRAVVAGISNSAGSGVTASISETLVNTTTAPVNVTYVYTLIANGCSNIQNVVVSVNPTPLLTSSLTPPAICGNATFNYTPTSSTTGTTFGWTRAAVAGISNVAASGSGNPGETLINTTAGAVNVTYIYTVLINGCANPATYNVVVSVKPTSALSSTLTPTAICNNTLFSYTATSGTASTSFGWTRAAVAGISNVAGSGGAASVSEILINTTANPVSVTYAYTLTAPNGCYTYYNVVVVVKPTPVLSSTQSTSSCNNTLFSYTATSATTGTTFSWTRAVVAGISNSAAIGGTASISETLVNTTTAPVNVTYVCTLIASGCSNIQNVVVSVNPTPLLTSSLAPPAICNNTTFNYTPTSSTTGTIFNWTRAAVAGISNVAGSGSGNPAETLINTTANPINVTYKYTLIKNGCANLSVYNVVVSIKPTPILISSLAPAAKCNNTLFSYTATSATTGTSFSWTRAAVAGISNSAGSGGTASISETLVNTTTTTINVTYVYTLVANGCSNTQNVVVKVYGKQVAPVISSAQTVCLFTNPALLTGTAALGGSLDGINYTYQWQNSTAATGPWSDVSGATSLTYQPPNTSYSFPDYYYRLVATDLCGTVISNSIWVEVVGGGSLTFSATGFPSGAVCPGTSFTGSISAIHFSSSAVRYSWSADAAYITPATGGPVGVTSSFIFGTYRSIGSIGSFTVKNNTTTTQTTTIAITPGVYNYSDPTIGSFLCNSSQTFVNVTIYPTPVVTATPALPTICSGTGTAIALSSNVTDNPTNYSWTATLQSGSATGFSNQASFVAGPLNQTIVNTGTTNAVIRYTITPMANCVGLPVIEDITVKPATAITTTGTLAAVCANASAQTTTLAYTTTNNNPTSYSIDWATITDQGNTAFSFLPGGGTLTGITIPAGTASGTYTGTMTITGANGCTGTKAVSVTVKAIPTVIVSASTVCGGAPATITATPGSGGTYSYVWTVPPTATNPGNVASFTSTITGNYSVVITNTVTGCVSVSSVPVNVSTASNTWTGASSSNWSLPGNWSCAAIPTAISDVIIPTGVATMPKLTGISLSKSLTLQTGTTLDLNGQDYTSFGGITGPGKLKGSALSNLTINAPGIASTLIFDQATDGTTNALNNLTVNGAGSSVTLNNKTSVYGTLTPIAGTLTLNDILVLRSTASTTASVGVVTGAISYGASGKVTVQRYYPSNRAWRLATSPLSGTGSVFNTWQNSGVYAAGIGTYVTGTTAGTGTNGLDNGPQLNSSLKVGDALAVVNDTKSMQLSSNAASAANKGFFLFVRGDRTAINFNTAYSNTTTLSSSGKLQTGNQTFPAVNTVGGYTLIGNPYASPVDFALLTKNNLSNSFYAWDPYLSTVGGYVFMTETFAGSGVYTGIPSRAGGQTGIIQSSQAFFVRTTGASPSLVFQETSKSSVNNLNVFRPMDDPSPAVMPSSFISNLSFYDNTGKAVLADGNLARFDDSYDPGVDLQDALKFNNVNETFSILSVGKSLVLSCRPLFNKEDTIFFKLTRTRQLKYQFEFEPIEINRDNLAGFLDDQFLHTVTPINMDDKTKVNFEVTADAASSAAERFRVIFKPSITYTDLTATVLNSDIGVEWNVANEFNIKVYDIERSTDSVNFTKVAEKLSSGNSAAAVGYSWLDVAPALGYYYYRIRSISNNNVIGYSNVVTVKLNKSTPAIYVFPNPVTENTLHLQMNTMAEGKYGTRLINNLGQVINTSNIYHLAGTATETIQPKNKLLNGIYQLEVTAPDNKTTTIQVLVK